MSPTSIVKKLWNYCNILRDYVERPTCHMCPLNRSRPGKRAVGPRL